MAEAQLQQFLAKVHQLNAFVALCEARPELRQSLAECSSHGEVVNLARAEGFEIGRRWGEADPPATNDASNLLAGSCPPQGEEHTRVLLQEAGLRLERIHSCAAASPAGFWFDQSEHEWVLLLQGSARLAFADGSPDMALSRGDSLLIPAGHRHRLVQTDPAPGTIWLALFWRAAG